MIYKEFEENIFEERLLDIAREGLSLECDTWTGVVFSGTKFKHSLKKLNGYFTNQ